MLKNFLKKLSEDSIKKRKLKEEKLRKREEKEEKLRKREEKRKLKEEKLREEKNLRKKLREEKNLKRNKRKLTLLYVYLWTQVERERLSRKNSLREEILVWIENFRVGRFIREFDSLKKEFLEKEYSKEYKRERFPIIITQYIRYELELIITKFDNEIQERKKLTMKLLKQELKRSNMYFKYVGVQVERKRVKNELLNYDEDEYKPFLNEQTKFLKFWYIYFTYLENIIKKIWKEGISRHLLSDWGMRDEYLNHK